MGAGYDPENLPRYQNSYNMALAQIDKLDGLINDTKERRALSRIADNLDGKVYMSEADAAVAFAETAVLATGNDANERVAVIINMQAPVTNEDGEIVMEDRHVLGPTLVGEHDNVIGELAGTYVMLGPWLLASGNTISFVHTHPYCTGHIPNEFSGDEGKDMGDIMGALVDNLKQGKALGDDLANYLGDAQVPWLPGGRNDVFGISDGKEAICV